MVVAGKESVHKMSEVNNLCCILNIINTNFCPVPSCPRRARRLRRIS